MRTNPKLQIKQVLAALTLLALTAFLTAGCNSASQAAPATPQVKTSIQFSWLHTIEFVGFYEAIRQGYYADAGLEVRLDGGGFDANGHYIDPVKQVVEGKSDFGVVGADVLLSARAQGQPVVAVAAIYQRSPVVLISLPEKNVIRPQDLVGKRVDTEPGTTVDVAYRALLASQNIDGSQIIETPRTDFTVNPLFNDSTDVLSGFITNDGVQAQQRREDLNFILMSDYGIDIYSNVIFTTEDMIKNKPDVVTDFVAATVKGMQWAVDNPESAAENVLNQYGDSMEPDIKNSQLAGLLISIPLLNPAGSRTGMMTPENWELAHQFLLDQGILKEPLDIKAAYDLTFLEAAYSNQ
jgi:ABC-type nitrate/sulfonate/bicarbonate transport system substrate-binding protein